MAVGAKQAGTYEVQVYVDGQWRQAGGYADRDTAVEEAETLAENPRYLSVKVLREDFDETKGLYFRKTVYRSGTFKDGSELRDAQAAQAYDRFTARHRQRKQQQAVQSASHQRLRKQRQKGTLFAFGLAARLLLIGGIGLGVLYWILGRY